jgi:hypothetical protein
VKFVFVFILFASTNLFAQLTWEQEVSVSSPAESASEVRRPLLVEASSQAVTKFTPELGYSVNDYKTQLEKKFSEYFEDFKKKKLTARFGKGSDKTLDPKIRDVFVAEIEKQRDEEFIKFSRSLDFIQSYSFLNLAQSDGVWKGKVKLVLDKVKLERQLRKIIKDESKTYSQLWVLTDINLQGLSWSDLGLDSDASFISALNASWVKWINDNLPQTVEEARSCEEACLSFYHRWEQLPEEEVIDALEQDFQNGLWAKITFYLRRHSLVERLQEQSFKWEGRLVLLDINTKRVLKSFELGAEDHRWRNLDQKGLNSALASQMYRSPLSLFNEFPKFLADKRSLNQLAHLIVSGHHNLSDAYALMELLKTRGSSLGLEPKLDSFKKGEAKLLCYYQGEEKSFTDLLSRLKELKSSKSYSLVHEFTGIQHHMKLVIE